MPARTAEDVRRDPKPGDVAKSDIGDIYECTGRESFGNCNAVQYLRNHQGPFRAIMPCWLNLFYFRDTRGDAEVTRIAQDS